MAKSRKLAAGRKLAANHKGHANHLCELTAKREMAKVASAARGAKYVCYICGRAAAKPISLCEPVEI